jgi:hypothetical protein
MKRKGDRVYRTMNSILRQAQEEGFSLPAPPSVGTGASRQGNGIHIEKTGSRIRSGMTKCIKSFLMQCSFSKILDSCWSLPRGRYGTGMTNKGKGFMTYYNSFRSRKYIQKYDPLTRTLSPRGRGEWVWISFMP